jgi:type I restriction enzyme, S subunit
VANFVPVRQLSQFSVGGGWGSVEDGPGLVPVDVIRGADFPSVERGDVSGLPRRYETIQRASSRILRGGDIILEISGGTKDRPTGRTVHISDSLLGRSEVPLIPASFCRLVRVDTSRAFPRYVYYWLKAMHSSGRTWGYQNRSTGISNFQFEYFLDAEKVRLPSLPEQQSIAEALGVLDDKIDANARVLPLITEVARSKWRRHSQDAPRIPLADVVEIGLSGVWGVDSWSEQSSVEVLCFRGKDLEDLVRGQQPSPPKRWMSVKQVERRVGRESEIWTAGSGSLGPTLLVTPKLRGAFNLPLMYSNFVKRLVARKGMDHVLLSAWFALLDNWDAGAFTVCTTGTAMPNLDASALLRTVAVPMFDAKQARDVAGWTDLVLDPVLMHETERLVRIRDTLLPRLLSGELRVRDAERLVGKVV